MAKKYGSVGHRIVAVIIDHIILGIICLIIAFPFGLTSVLFSMADLNVFMSLLASGFAVLSAVIWIVYFTYFEGTTGQTPGKKLLDIKVVSGSGRQPTMGAALIRTILRIIDGIAFYILGLVIILLTEKKQRLGDILANTVVVKA